MIIRECKICGKEFKTYPSKVRAGKGKYCSKHCSNAVTLIKKGERRSLSTEIKKGQKLALGNKNGISWNSGTKGVMKPNKTSFRKGEHRNPKTEFKKGTPIEQHPRWKGGISAEPWGRDFNKELKESIRARDNFICQLCGVPEIEFNTNLNIHHIDMNPKNNDKRNLISLCFRCHMTVHHKGVMLYPCK